ncbi:MAG: protein kinase [Planctomycetaceae bacterium]
MVDSRLAQMFPLRGTPDDRVPSVTGINLGHFVLQNRIGQGGMGSVFEAKDTRLDRLDALKVLAPHQSADPAIVQRFQNEARAAAKLDHENIARVHYIGEDNGIHFIAFEYVRGVTIRELIQRRGHLNSADSVNYTLQVAEALKQTDAAGLVHRDIKPSNLIVMPDGRVKLVDLGLARQFLIDPENDPELTASGTTLGTFDYISPEQSRDPRNVDVRSDIYSLGCTLFHMLTGRAPYEGANPLDKLLRHGEEETPFASDFNSAVSPRLAVVVRRMMAPHPDERYQTPDDLIDDLTTVAVGLGLQAVGPTGTIWKQPLFPQRGLLADRHRGWFLAFGVLFALMLVSDTIYRWYREFQGSTPALVVNSDLSLQNHLPDSPVLPSRPYDNDPAGANNFTQPRVAPTTFPTDTTPGRLQPVPPPGTTTPLTPAVDPAGTDVRVAGTTPATEGTVPPANTGNSTESHPSVAANLPSGQSLTETGTGTAVGIDAETANHGPRPLHPVDTGIVRAPFDTARLTPFDVTIADILNGTADGSTAGTNPARTNTRPGTGVAETAMAAATNSVETTAAGNGAGSPSIVGSTRPSTDGNLPSTGTGTPPATPAATSTGATAQTVIADPFPFVLLTKGGAERRRYATLESACLEADDNAEIEIDHDGLLPQPQRPIIIRNKRLTIRPTLGKRPRIAFAPGNDLLHSTSVRMIAIEGESATLQLFDIDLEMTVAGNPFAEEWALFSLSQARQLLLKRVTTTIENPQGRTAVFLDRRTRVDRRVDMMPNPAAMRNTEIVCVDVLFRGAANLYNERTRDEGSLRLSQVGIAIDGDILSLTGVDLVDMEKPGIGRPVLRCEFDHVSAVTPRRFLAIDTAEVRDCADIDIICNNSVIDLSGSESPLFSLKSHLDSDALQSRVAWRGTHNVLATSTDTAMRVIGSLPRADDSWTANFGEWQETYHVGRTSFERTSVPVILAGRLKTAARLTQSTLDDFRLIETLDDGTLKNPALGTAADRSNAGFDPTRSELSPPTAD